jgi:hypothetical protein
MPPGLTFKNSTFCPHSVFVCFVWICEQTAIISLYREKEKEGGGGVANGASYTQLDQRHSLHGAMTTRRTTEQDFEDELKKL